MQPSACKAASAAAAAEPEPFAGSSHGAEAEFAKHGRGMERAAAGHLLAIGVTIIAPLTLRLIVCLQRKIGPATFDVSHVARKPLPALSSFLFSTDQDVGTRFDKNKGFRVSRTCIVSSSSR